MTKCDQKCNKILGTLFDKTVDILESKILWPSNEYIIKVARTLDYGIMFQVHNNLHKISIIQILKADSILLLLYFITSCSVFIQIKYDPGYVS